MMLTKRRACIDAELCWRRSTSTAVFSAVLIPHQLQTQLLVLLTLVCNSCTSLLLVFLPFHRVLWTCPPISRGSRPSCCSSFSTNSCFCHLTHSHALRIWMRSIRQPNLLVAALPFVLSAASLLWRNPFFSLLIPSKYICRSCAR